MTTRQPPFAINLCEFWILTVCIFLGTVFLWKLTRWRTSQVWSVTYVYLFTSFLFVGRYSFSAYKISKSKSNIHNTYCTWSIWENSNTWNRNISDFLIPNIRCFPQLQGLLGKKMRSLFIQLGGMPLPYTSRYLWYFNPMHLQPAEHFLQIWQSSQLLLATISLRIRLCKHILPNVSDFPYSMFRGVNKTP